MEESRNFAWPETSINLEDLEAFNSWYERNEETIKKNKIIIWGAGIRGTEFRFFFQKKKHEDILFTDSDQKKWGGNINGILIIPPNDARGMVDAGHARFLLSVENSKEIEKKLMDWNYKRDIDFFIAKTELYDKYVEEFRRAYQCEDLFMGDCLFSTISMNDTISDDLKKILRGKIGVSRCKVLAMHGISMSSMYYIFKAQLDEGLVPENLILEINPEMMTGKQHLLPRSQHENLLKKIYETLSHSDKDFEKYLEKVKERSKNYQIEFYVNESGNMRRGINAVNYFKLNYLYKLRSNSEAIDMLKKILQVGRKNNVRILGFIPPVNYMYAEKLFGKEFFVKYDAIREGLKSVADNDGILLLDYSYEFKSEEFSEPDSSSETLNEVGRIKLANSMIAALEERSNGT